MLRSTQSQAACLPLWCIPALAAYAAFLFVPQVLNDGDTYSHIATGNWILRHSAVPRFDPFSYTFAGAPWTAHEWFSELLMAISFFLGGWNGLLVLFGLASALTMGLLTVHLARWLDFLSLAIVLLIAAACISPGLLARPHILVLPILELWTVELLIASELGRPPWRILPLMLIWANMHGSFILGLLMVFPSALEAILHNDTERQKAAAVWALFLGGAILSAVINPWGWRELLFPFQLLRMKELDSIAEWRPPNFQHMQPIELALMTVLYVCLSRGVRIPVPRLVTLMALLHLAIQHSRHQMVAGIVGALTIAAPIGRELNLPPINRRMARGPTCFVLIGFLSICVATTALRVSKPIKATDIPNTPAKALDHVPAKLAARPVLNDYSWGGYLIFRGLRPFIDSRADMYGDAFLLQYAEIMRPDRELLLQTLEGRSIDWTILPPPSPANPILNTLPGWCLLYADDQAVIHARTQALGVDQDVPDHRCPDRP